MKELILNKKSKILEFSESKISSKDITTINKFKKLVIKEGNNGLRKISKMLKEKEIKSFKVSKSFSANKLIGVQEINDYLKGLITLEQCKDLINIKTRQYAKRQNTWARGHMKNWNKLYSKNFSNLLKKSLKVVT